MLLRNIFSSLVAVAIMRLKFYTTIFLNSLSRDVSIINGFFMEMMSYGDDLSCQFSNFFSLCHFDNKKAFRLSHQKPFYIIISWLFSKSISSLNLCSFVCQWQTKMCTLNKFVDWPKICDNFCNFFFIILSNFTSGHSHLFKHRLELTKSQLKLRQIFIRFHSKNRQLELWGDCAMVLSPFEMNFCNFVIT